MGCTHEQKHPGCCSCHEHEEHEHDCSCHKHEEHEHGCSCHKHEEHEHGCGCGCRHDHHHSEQDVRRAVMRILVCALLLAAVFCMDHLLSLPLWGSLLLYLIPYLASGWDILYAAVRGFLRRQVFGETFLMSIATLGALGIGFLPGAEPEFPEAVFVMLFYRVGELLEQIAEGSSRRSIAQLMDIRPDSAVVMRRGIPTVVHPQDVEPGEVIQIRPGERVALDGIVLEGSSALDTVALTGESVPRDVGPKDPVVSGAINLNGVLLVRVTHRYTESTVSRILELVEHAGANKATSERFITKFSRWYTPSVVCAAVLLAVLPPILSGDFWNNAAIWLIRALSFLVVSCPCALIISVPTTFFGGISSASRNGILIKGSRYLEQLAKVRTMVFDKTGTLTQGSFSVTAVHPHGCSEAQLLHLAAHVERHSSHPIARALRQAYPNEADSCIVTDVQEIAGQGVRGRINGFEVCAGNEHMMEAVGAAWQEGTHSGTVIHVAASGKYAGYIVISDQLKPDAAQAIAQLRQAGVQETVLLTGDQEAAAADTAQALSIDSWYAQLLPDEKVSHMSRIAAQQRTGTAAYVGDGINDAPVLAGADLGIAMGAMGSDAAIEAADIVLMDDHPAKLALAIQIAQRTMGIARENIAFILAVKLGVLILAALGKAPMWLAVFADVGVTALATLNAARALTMPGQKQKTE